MIKRIKPDSIIFLFRRAAITCPHCGERDEVSFRFLKETAQTCGCQFCHGLMEIDMEINR
jgi:uncharacterized Zn finger protein